MIRLPWLLAACRLHGLDDVPIRGASPAQREAIEAELAAFDRATGGGRVRLSRIVVHRDAVRDGDWTPALHRIRLADDLAPDEVAPVLRHELCHALDTAEGPFYAAHDALWGRLGSGLEDLGVEFGCDDRDCSKREAFAMFCELGAWSAQAGAAACPGDEPDGTAAFALLDAEVWTGARAASSTASPDAPTVASAYVPNEVSAWATGESPTTALFFWAPAGEETEDRGAFDVWTGQAVSGNFLDLLSATPHEVPADVPTGVSVRGVSGRSSGPAFLEIAIIPQHLPAMDRWVWVDGADWAALDDGCPRDGPHPFWADDAVFDLWVDGRAFRWALVVPSDDS